MGSEKNEAKDAVKRDTITPLDLVLAFGELMGQVQRGFATWNTLLSPAELLRHVHGLGLVEIRRAFAFLSGAYS